MPFFWLTPPMPKFRTKPNTPKFYGPRLPKPPTPKFDPCDPRRPRYLPDSFFSNVITQLRIPQFKDINFSAEYISHSALKAIMKFRNHPNVSAIRNAMNPQSFNLSNVNVDDVLKKINKLGLSIT